MSPNFYALASAFCFASASVVFGIFASRTSVLWMTAFKAFIALISFGAIAICLQSWDHLPALASVNAFLISGFLGLLLADLFLVRAFATIGSARTLMIFSFQPIALGALGYFFFNQSISATKAIAIVFMIGCVFILSFEKFRELGRWEIRGPVYALIGMLLDALGIGLTRYAFDTDAQISTIDGNLYRCIGAAFGFYVISFFKPFQLWSSFQNFSKKSKTAILLACLLGTTVSLGFYMVAVSQGHLSTVSAIIGASPIFAAVWECILNKRLPSSFLMAAFILFGAGFYFLL